MTFVDEFQDGPIGWMALRFAEAKERTFLHDKSGLHDYSKLLERMSYHKSRLNAAGVDSGHVVALVTDYTFDAVALLLALIDRRCVIAPISSFVESEIAERLASIPVRWIFRGEELVADAISTSAIAAAGPLVRLQERGRAGLILFSSGSTGTPKAMLHDLEELLSGYSRKRVRTLSLIVFLMFDHIGGLNTLFTGLASTAELIVPQSRQPEHVCELIAKFRVAVLPSSPTFLNLLLLSGALDRHDLSSLRVITYGTEPMPESLLARLHGAFPRVRLIQTFGTSETGISQTSSASSSSTLLKLDDPDLQWKIVDGELWLKSRTQILGYLNHSMESFTADGWFRTGDLVETTADGYLRINGRRNELINVGGQKVLPSEVESVLLEMAEVEDCLVYKEPHSITGQIVCAKVVLKTGRSIENLRTEVRRFCLTRLDSYKVPVKVTAVDGPLYGARFKKSRSA